MISKSVSFEEGVAGYRRLGELLSSAELYEPKTETFTRLTNNPSTYGTATLLPNGRVLITGFGIAELYRPKRKNFVSAGNLLDPGHDAAVRLTDGDVLLYGKDLCIGFQLHCDSVTPPRFTAGVRANSSWSKAA